MYNKIVIGIDESYARCGISIAVDGELKKVNSIKFNKFFNTKSEKRLHLSKVINMILTKNKDKAKEIIIICERIRTMSQGPNKKQGFGLKPDYLKSTGALIATIVDAAYQHSVPVYSVDTRSWKSKILGSSKTDINRYKNYEKPEKAKAIEFIVKKGFDLKIYDNEGNQKVHSKGKDAGKLFYDDDAADSACIALYGFIPTKQQNLKLED